jgi:hypothetical protein
MTERRPERAGREGDQDLPVAGRESVFAELRRRVEQAHAEELRRIDAREATGVKRYARSLETFNGRDAGRDLEEELLDGLAYATQLRLERNALAEAVKVLTRHARREPVTGPELFAALELGRVLQDLHQRG